MNVNEVRFRCSKSGCLMTESRTGAITDKQLEAIADLQAKSKTDKGITDKQAEELKRLVHKRDNPELSQTTKDYLAEVYIGLRYGRRKVATTKYMEKGLQVEEDSITLYSRVKRIMLKKNEIRFHNEYIEGTPDNVEEEVLDVKSCWDIFTFFKTTRTELVKEYYWQLQCYMELTGRKGSNLAYCLVNTPDPLIQDEKRKLSWKMGGIDSEMNPDYVKACEEIDLLSIYDDIPLAERLNEIKVPFDQAAIDKLYARIRQCREYMAATWPDFFPATENKIIQDIKPKLNGKSARKIQQ